MIDEGWAAAFKHIDEVIIPEMLEDLKRESPFQNYCEIHHRHESTKELYGSCLECGHVWRTKQEFLDDVAAIERVMELAPSWSHLLICPLCTHDL